MKETGIQIIKIMCLAIVETYNTKEAQMKQQALSREVGMASWREVALELGVGNWGSPRDLNIYGGSKNSKEVRVVADCKDKWQQIKLEKRCVLYRTVLGCLVEE